jgi:outer membrane protein TolC
MVAAAETRVDMAKREYFPDFTMAGAYFARGRQFDDMWSLTTTFNIPLFYRSKQRQAVYEADASQTEARAEAEATRLMIASALQDNYSMVKAMDKLMSLYEDGLIPKSHQDYELALSGYSTGSIDALTVITRLKSVIDLEITHWGHFAEREKAIARIEAITGLGDQRKQKTEN